MTVEEESPPGTEVGRVSASDPDEDGTDNAAVGFAIVDGDDDGVFDIVQGGEAGEDLREGVIVVRGRLDREKAEEYLLTVGRTFKWKNIYIV